MPPTKSIGLLVGALGMGAVAACGQDAVKSEQPGNGTPASTAFQCGETRVATELSGDRLQLRLDGERHRLLRERSASGAQYRSQNADPPILFWDKGDEALLEIGKRRYPVCRPIDAAGKPALPFEAGGFEPGWHLKITERRIQLAWAYGEKTATTPLPAGVPTADGYRYRAETESHRLIVDIADTLCRDAATGMPHPKRVNVRIDDETLRGCGRAPSGLLTGQPWLVTQLAGQDLIDDGRISLDFGVDGRLSGQATCNRYSAQYRLREGLRIDPIATTKKACAPTLMDQEALFLELLDDVRRFDFSASGTLILITGEERRITARR